MTWVLYPFLIKEYSKVGESKAGTTPCWGVWCPFCPFCLSRALPLVCLPFLGHRVILNPLSIPLEASWLQGEGGILLIQRQPPGYLLDCGAYG